MLEINFQLDKNYLAGQVKSLILDKILGNNPLIKRLIKPYLQRFYFEDLAIRKHLNIYVDRIKINKADHDLFQQAYGKMEPAEKKLFNIWQLRFPSLNPQAEGLIKEVVENLLKGLKNEAEFVSLERTYQLAAFPSTPPNDPRYRPSDPLHPLNRMDCDDAWKKSVGKDVVVAVIDTGIYEKHQDIGNSLLKNGAGQIIAEACLVGVTSPTWQDQNGHGTHVAGIIAATGNNSKGIIGVAPEAKIIPIRVFSAQTTSKSRNIANALFLAEFIENKKVQIINNSWYYDGEAGPFGHLDSTEDDEALLTAVQFVLSQNVVCVFAAGNKSRNIDDYWLLKEPNAIVVGATKAANDSILALSNNSNQIAIAAPGELIESLDYSGTNAYTTMSGTSMAAAYVSGAIALYISSKGGGRISPADIKSRLRNSSYSHPIPDATIGGFRVNCHKFLS
jgi:subtilisin family serine protease